MKSFLEWARPKFREQLEGDILPFWLSPSLIGNPVGLFPTWVNQNGVPDFERPNFVRMHGRQTYGYLTAHKIVGSRELLEYGLSGLRRLETYEHPDGGYYSTVNSQGVPNPTPISIQDQCYSVFPYVMAFRVTGRHEYLDKIWRFVEFIDKGPYLREDGSYVDSLLPDHKTVVPFETPTLNIVAAVDFLNAVLIPALEVAPAEDLTDERKQILIKWVNLLVREFYGKGLFWNERGNRTDYQAKHVDLGHTSKAYGILLKANRLFKRWGMPNLYEDIAENYPSLALAAARDKVGWWTNFDVSNVTFRDGELEWWRHILINQTVYLFAQDKPELVPVLENGVRAWFDCEYADRKRPCRGIRSNLKPNGRMLPDDDAMTCKANCWKSCYHEVEHVLTFLDDNP